MSGCRTGAEAVLRLFSETKPIDSTVIDPGGERFNHLCTKYTVHPRYWSDYAANFATERRRELA